VSAAPDTCDDGGDRIFRGIAWFSASLIIVLTAYILWEIGSELRVVMRRLPSG
jgi:phosphate transport system permease protein